jgi:hypothetical protein
MATLIHHWALDKDQLFQGAVYRGKLRKHFQQL